MYAFIKIYEFSWSSNMRILAILGSLRDLVCTLLFKKKKKNKKKKKTKQKNNKKTKTKNNNKKQIYLEAYFSMLQIWICLNFFSMDHRS